tara:strand:- start:1409 stop:2956 length:1548 start_codon:yes stop_codon:yes gene_type:complete
MISRLIAIFVLLCTPFSVLKSQIKKVDLSIEENSQILGKVDMGSQGFFLLTGQTISKSESSSFFLHKYSSDLELIFKAQIPYEKKRFSLFLWPTVYVSPDSKHAYVIWMDDKNHLIHQINENGDIKKMVLTKTKFRDIPYTFFCTNSNLVGIVYKEKTKSYFLGLIDHASFRAKPAKPISLPKIQKMEMFDEHQTTWEFINYDQDHLIFSRRVKMRNEEAQDEEEHEDRMLNKILVAEIDLKGKFIKEISIERALQNEYRPIVSRTYEKGPNSSIYYLCIPGEIPVNQNVIGNNIGRIEGEFYTYNIVSTKREQTRLTPNQNAYGTLVYVPETGHYIYYGLHNKGDLDNDFERTPFHGFFISEYDQNGSLINHSQHIAPTTEEFEDSDLNSRLKGGFGRQMKLEINDDGSYRFKVWTNKDIYIAELNSKLELLEYNLYVLDINALASSTLGDLALYPESHPINNYLNSLGEELFLDLASISYIHSFQSSPGKEILLHLTDVDNPENISLLLFSEN